MAAAAAATVASAAASSCAVECAAAHSLPVCMPAFSLRWRARGVAGHAAGGWPPACSGSALTCAAGAAHQAQGGCRPADGLLAHQGLLNGHVQHRGGRLNAELVAVEPVAGQVARHLARWQRRVLGDEGGGRSAGTDAQAFQVAGDVLFLRSGGLGLIGGAGKGGAEGGERQHARAPRIALHASHTAACARAARPSPPV